MLQFIRDKFTGVIAILVIGAIAVTLVISFGNMDQGAAVGNYAAEVNGEEIGMQLYQRAFQTQLARQQEALRGDLPEELQRQIKQNALDGLIQNRVVAQYVREAGYRVADQRVAQAIVAQPIFQVGGRFSQESYIAVLASQGLTPEFFEQEQRAQMQIAQLESGILSSDFFTPSEYRRYIELLAEERSATLLMINPLELAETLELEEGEALAYYEANPGPFTLPESVTLEYVRIQPEDVDEQISIAEQDIRDYYDANADLYVAEDQRQSRHILIAVSEEMPEDDARALAEDLYQRIEAGEDFAALAREFSDDPVSGELGGDLGWASRGDFVGPFEEALFALDIGEVSTPVRTEFGYHVIRLEDIQAGSLRTYEDVREELVVELRQQAATDRYYELAEQIDDLALENPASLQPIQAATGIDIQRIENFTRAGGEPLGFQPEVIRAAFSLAVLEDGENSPLIELNDGSAVVLRVEEYREATVQPFESVADQAAEAALALRATQSARDRGTEMLALLEAGTPIEQVAENYGVEIRTTDMLNRSAVDYGAEITAEIFRAPYSGGDQPVYGGLQMANGGYTVYRLDKVEPGRAEDIPQEARDQRKELLARQSGGTAVLSVLADLREQADVLIAPGLFDEPEAF